MSHLSSYSKYTISIKEIVGTLKIDLGLKNYPIYDESHREELNKRIIDHYWEREIGQETIQSFYHNLNVKMNEIMPYYNQMYESESVDFDPLNNIKIDETYKSKTHNSSEGGSTAESSGTNDQTNKTQAHVVGLESGYPQENSGGLDTRYKTGGTKSDTTGEDVISDKTSNKGSTTNRDSGETTQEWSRHEEGSSAGLPFSRAIAQWREIMLNIDMQIIEELDELFMQIW